MPAREKRGRLSWVPFASEITPEEMALGFQCIDYAPHGSLVTAKLGIGIRAVKMIEAGLVSYVICDDEYIVLYPSALSIADLRLRFGLGDDDSKAG